jgi:hypothetical protein
MRPDEIELVVQAAVQKAFADAVAPAVQAAVTNVLTTFGIEQDDRKEIREDFRQLRRWRKSVEQAQSMTFKAILTTLVGGFLGAIWMGIKVYFEK